MSGTYAGANTYGTSITIPSDGDLRNASSVNVAFEALADRTAWLKARIGVRQLISITQINAAIGAGWGNTAAYVTTPGTSPGTVLQDASIVGASGDLIELVGSYTMTYATAVGLAYMRAEYFSNYLGAATPTSFDAHSETKTLFGADGTVNVSIVSAYSVTSPGQVGIFLNGQVQTSGTGTAHWVIAQGQMLVRQWRLN